MNVFLNNPEFAIQLAKLKRSEDIAHAPRRRDVREARRSRPVEDAFTAVKPPHTRFVFEVLRAVRSMNIL